MSPHEWIINAGAHSTSKFVPIRHRRSISTWLSNFAQLQCNQILEKSSPTISKSCPESSNSRLFKTSFWTKACCCWKVCFKKPQTVWATFSYYFPRLASLSKMFVVLFQNDKTRKSSSWDLPVWAISRACHKHILE